MELDVKKIKNKKGKSLNFEFEESFQPIIIKGEKVAFKEKVNIKGHATNIGNTILIEGRIYSKLAVNCSRCLDPFVLEKRLEFLEEYVDVSRLHILDKENNEYHDREIHTFEDDTIVIDREVTENIILSIPMKFLCSIECKGLCVECGADLNYNKCNCIKEKVDPRLEKLKNWF